MQWRQLDHRPTGITIMAILQIIGAIPTILSGVFLSLLGGSTALLGVLYVPLGIFSLFAGYGLYRGRGWTWTVVVILQIIGVPLGVAVGLLLGGGITSLVGAIPGVILAIIILSYMFRPTTRAYFGKAQLSE